MSTRYPEIFASLAAPFAADVVRSRKHDGICYITARAVMTRLDEVVGPENWNASYEGWSDDAVMCRLSITLPDGTVVTKCDVGAYTRLADNNKADPGDDDKGGLSDALKRAAVLFGVGRYLYGDGAPRYAVGEAPTTTPPIEVDPPRPTAQTRPQTQPQTTHVNGKAHDGPPRTGKALYAWTKDQEQTYEVGLLKYLNQWAKLNDLPGRMVDWDAGQVQLAFQEASRKLQSIRSREREEEEVPV